MITMKVLFIFAHPDDESFSSGGTITLLAKKGVKPVLITATRGENGQTGGLCKQEQLGFIREQEQKAAGKILGILKIYQLGFKDGSLNKLPKNKLENKIFKILKKEKPDIVVTFNEEGGSRHPDHIHVSKSTTEAFFEYLKVSEKYVRLYYSATPRSFIEKLRSEGMDYRVYGKIKGTPDPQITTIIDISETFNAKIKALKCHRTQKKDWERFLKRMKHREIKKEFFRLVGENSLC